MMMVAHAALAFVFVMPLSRGSTIVLPTHGTNRCGGEQVVPHLICRRLLCGVAYATCAWQLQPVAACWQRSFYCSRQLFVPILACLRLIFIYNQPPSSPSDARRPRTPGKAASSAAKLDGFWVSRNRQPPMLQLPEEGRRCLRLLYGHPDRGPTRFGMLETSQAPVNQLGVPISLASPDNGGRGEDQGTLYDWPLSHRAKRVIATM
jgi:hypothetical protein